MSIHKSSQVILVRLGSKCNPPCIKNYKSGKQNGCTNTYPVKSREWLPVEWCLSFQKCITWNKDNNHLETHECKNRKTNIKSHDQKIIYLEENRKTNIKSNPKIIILHD